jgi:hypothetical protein
VEATAATPAPPPARRRPSRRDLALGAVALLMVIATTSDVFDTYRLRERGPEDTRAMRAYTRHAFPGQRFGITKVAQAIAGLDVICADHLKRKRSDFRLCVIVRHTGTLDRRVVGGYRRPARAFEEESDHYACFGRAIPLKFCAHKHRRRLAPPV